MVRERRSREVPTWRDYKVEFENKYYSRQHRKTKEQEFLALRQGNMIVLEYKRWFQDLYMFSSTFLPTKQHKIERLRDELRQDLKSGLIALQFRIVRELIEAAQSFKTVIDEDQQGMAEQGQSRVGKREKHVFFLSRPPPLNKGNSGQFGQLKKKGWDFSSREASGGSFQGISRVSVGDNHARESVQQKDIQSRGCLPIYCG